MRALRCSSAPRIWGADPPNLSPRPPPMNSNQPSPGPLEWKGKGVTIAQVLDALTDFRNKFAQPQVPDDDHPHPRNTVMTLIAVPATEAEEKRAISESTAIAMHHPSLVIQVSAQSEAK